MNGDFQAVKERIDFRRYVERYVVVKQKKALCLFHNDRNPSMHIYEDSFHCFQCGASGDVFDIAMKVHGWDKQTALTELAKEAGVMLDTSEEQKARQQKRERLYALMDHAAQFFAARLYDNDEALDYLCRVRGLSLDTIESCRLGYAPDDWQRLRKHLYSVGYPDSEMHEAGLIFKKDDMFYVKFRHRIMIPILDHKGRVIGFSGRALQKDQQPKYLYNTGFDKSKNIHAIGLNRAVGAFSQGVVVEGSLDPISAANRGVYNVFSQMGSDLSDEQLTLLCKTGITRLIFCLDNDQTGMKALRTLVEKHMHRAADQGVELYAMQSPHGKDPDDCFRERPELWQAAVEAARPVVDILIERETAALDASPVRVQAAAVRLLPVLKGANAFVSHDNVQKLSSAIGYPADVIDQWARSQIEVLPRNPAPKAPSVGPTYEHWVLFYILRFEAKEYLSGAKQVLVNASRGLEYHHDHASFFGGLRPCDFTDAALSRLMAMIVTADTNREPLVDTLDQYIDEPVLREVFERVIGAYDWAVMVGQYPEVSYRVFLDLTLTLRIARLEAESEAYMSDIPRWVRYNEAIAALSDARGAL